MAWVRKRTRKTVTTFTLHAKGCKPRTFKGPKAEAFAMAALGRLKELELADLAGIELPRTCLWRLSTLKEAHMAEAERRGLAVRHFEYRYGNLMAGMGDVPLDRITRGSWAAYVRTRSANVRGATINRDLVILRSGLKLARELAEDSGYSGDCLVAVRPLEERKSRRVGIVLTHDQDAKLLALFTGPMANAVEFLLLTASRLSQLHAWQVQDQLLFFPAHKRGEGRHFILDGRLAELVRLPMQWSRREWDRQIKLFEVPDLHAHDLRYTRITRALRDGWDQLSVQNLGGWTSLQMVIIYGKLIPKPMRLGPAAGHLIPSNEGIQETPQQANSLQTLIGQDIN